MLGKFEFNTVSKMWKQICLNVAAVYIFLSNMSSLLGVGVSLCVCVCVREGVRAVRLHWKLFL